MNPPRPLGPHWALMIVDLQNDFLAPDGAYARGGAISAEALALVPRVAELAQVMRGRGALITASRFTLWPDASGEPMISDHLRTLRPFLRRGDFQPGSPGQALIPAIADQVHVCVDKIAYSAFFGTQLDWLLRKTRIETLVVCGITTNGGVATTARDAHVRDLNVIVLADGCAAPTPARHEAALADLASVASIVHCSELIDRMR